VEQEQWLRLWGQWKATKDPAVREELVRACAPLVKRQVSSFFSTTILDEDDLFNIGMLGVWDALEKYDPSRGVQFETFAAWRVRGAILDELRKMDWLPRGQREQMRETARAVEKLQQEKMRHVTDEEVAEYLGVRLEELHRQMVRSEQAKWLPIEQEDDEQLPLFERLPDENAPELDHLVHQQRVQELLADCIARLPEKERLVLTLYYYEELTVQEIAQVMNLSAARISQLHKKAIYRLRGMLGKRKAFIYGHG